MPFEDVDYLINVLLLAASLLFGAIAVLKETRTKEGVFTKWGWVAILGLIVTFFLSLYKEKRELDKKLSEQVVLIAKEKAERIFKDSVALSLQGTLSASNNIILQTREINSSQGKIISELSNTIKLQKSSIIKDSVNYVLANYSFLPFAVSLALQFDLDNILYDNPAIIKEFDSLLILDQSKDDIFCWDGTLLISKDSKYFSKFFNGEIFSLRIIGPNEMLEAFVNFKQDAFIVQKALQNVGGIRYDPKKREIYVEVYTENVSIIENSLLASNYFKMENKKIEIHSAVNLRISDIFTFQIYYGPSYSKSITFNKKDSVTGDYSKTYHYSFQNLKSKIK